MIAYMPPIRQMPAWPVCQVFLKAEGYKLYALTVLRTARTMDKPIVDSTTSSMSAPMVSAFGQGKFFFLNPSKHV